MQWFSFGTYIGIIPYRTLAVLWTAMYGSYVMYVVWENTNFVHFSCDMGKYSTRPIWVRCSPKGSHLIHWTSAEFAHIALEWTLFVYLITPCAPDIGFISTILCFLPIRDNLANQIKSNHIFPSSGHWISDWQQKSSLWQMVDAHWINVESTWCSTLSVVWWYDIQLVMIALTNSEN